MLSNSEIGIAGVERYCDCCSVCVRWRSVSLLLEDVSDPLTGVTRVVLGGSSGAAKATRCSSRSGEGGGVGYVS